MRKGAMDKGKGKLKEAAGKATGNERLTAEGRTDQVKGKMKEVAEKSRERAEGIGRSLRRDDDA